MSSHRGNSTPAAKRRRVDAANATLRKPFRSPLLGRPRTADSPISSVGTPGPRSSLSVEFSPSQAAVRSNDRSMHKQARSSSRFGTLASPTKRKTLAVLAAASASSIQGWDQLFEKLDVARSMADAATRSAQAELDLISQTAALEKQSLSRRTDGPVDAELRELVQKWKVASRMAAEELFELVKVRVDSAWGFRMRNAEKGLGSFENDVIPRESERRLSADEILDQAEVGSGSDEGARDDLKARHAGDRHNDESDADFNMLAMLKSLNIDPVVIGYDPIEELWQGQT